MSSQAKDPFIFNEEGNNDEIKFGLIFSFFLRNKKIISFFAALITFFGGFAFLFQKRAWQGEFQIVVENELGITPGGLGSELKAAESLLGGGSANFLDTELAILESPSILMPIFEYIKNEKIKKNRSARNLGFKKWKAKQLNINILEDTSVLELVYRDSDKDLILPVLEKISSGYQEYSGRKKSRNLELGKDFFNNQIEIYKRKSEDSLKDVQIFASENDLAVVEVKTETESESEVDEDYTKSINIERIRIENSNIIKKAKFQLEELERVDEDTEKIINFGRSIPSLVETGVLEKISQINLDIAVKKLNYRNNDPILIRLEKQRNELIKLLKKEVIVYWKQIIANAESALKAAERPEEVVIKYKQLLAQAKRDAITLEKLETNYILLLLDEAREEDPWQLITSPTLLEKPVSPNLINTILLSLILGISIGSLIVYFKEYKENKIYTKDQIKAPSNNLINYVFNYDKIENIKNTLNLLLESILFQKDDQIAIINCGIDNSELEQVFKNYLEIRPSNKKVDFISSDLINGLYTKSILLVHFGFTSINEINRIKKKLKLNAIEDVGFIAIKGNKDDKNKETIRESLLKVYSYLKELISKN